MKHYVLCLVDTDEAAQEVTEKVASAGFAKEELFVLTSGRGNTDDSADQREAKAGERGPLSEGTGLLAGIGPVVVGGGGDLTGAGRTMDASDSGEIGVEEGEGSIPRSFWSVRGHSATVPKQVGGRRSSHCRASR